LALLSIIAIWISSKYEETKILHIDDLALILNHAVSTQTIIMVEKKILEFFNFEIGMPTILEFYGL
jgi:hypothetical protein